MAADTAAKNPQPLARVHWEVMATGARHQGDPMPLDQAKVTARVANKDWPTLHHWVEPAEPERP